MTMILGIVAEYNPFHNGHKYMIRKAVDQSGADTVVAVMSGSFVQRGEPAIMNKWARAESALSNGVDLVVELPVYYSVQSAEFFAKGAIAILNALGTDCVAFGAETDDIEALSAAADILKKQPPEYVSALKSELKKGVSFPAAREKALGDLGRVVRDANNILAVEYIKAGAKNPLAVKRIGAGHDSAYFCGNIASASYIRQNPSADFVPDYNTIIREKSEGRFPVTLSALDEIILGRLRTDSAENLRKICDVTEGLESRIIEACKNSVSINQLIDRVKTKRYTRSRISRIMINYILGITKELQGISPQYIRVLGGNKKGFAVLKDCPLPVITKASEFCSELFEYELRATDLYTMLYPDKSKRTGSADYYNKIIVK